MSKNFRDYFSEQAKLYSQYRPTYPPELYDYLASLTSGHELAWDCGTGNGQAALELAERYGQVIATDASIQQIDNAFPHPRISYRVEQAEDTSIPSNSVDLITVGTAVHWFDFDPFYTEVRRVAKPGGILAVWTYHALTVDPAIDKLFHHYYADILKGYWPPRFHYLDERYKTLPFPFHEIQPPEFFIQENWNFHQLVGFLASWSAAQRYFEANGQHAIQLIINDLRESWGPEEQARTIRWPLYMRIGEVKDE
jgi:SAM-dependent methyltransferase